MRLLAMNRRHMVYFKVLMMAVKRHPAKKARQSRKVSVP
jgi:hypothetical protein